MKYVIPIIDSDGGFGHLELNEKPVCDVCLGPITCAQKIDGAWRLSCTQHQHTNKRREKGSVH